MNSDKMLKYIIYGSVVFVIIAGAFWEGYNTSRWKDPQNPVLDTFILGIRDIPVTIGLWTGDTATESREMTPLTANEAGAKGMLTRSYTSSGVEKAVMMTIICGFSRKVAIHTPDACYVGSGFRIEGEIEEISINYMPKRQVNDIQTGKRVEQMMRSAEFKTALFVKTGPDGQVENTQRVFWSMKGSESNWQMPEAPRQRWPSTTPINKLYLSTIDRIGETFDSKTHPAVLFAQELLPELEILLDGMYLQETLSEKVDGAETEKKQDYAPSDSSENNAAESSSITPVRRRDSKKEPHSDSKNTPATESESKSPDAQEVSLPGLEGLPEMSEEPTSKETSDFKGSSDESLPGLGEPSGLPQAPSGVDELPGLDIPETTSEPSGVGE